MMNLAQGDCRCGSLAFVAGADLSAAAGKLAKLNAEGHVILAAAASDVCPYVVACGSDEGYLTGVLPLSSVANARVALSGACSPGDVLVSKGDGRVEAQTDETLGLPVGVAEEVGVDGQRVLLRPMPSVAIPTGPEPVDGHGVFTMDAAAVAGCPEDPADLVGKVIVSDNTGVWHATGHPVTPVVTAVVTGYASGLLVCVVVNFNDTEGMMSIMPVSVLTGTPGYGLSVAVADAGGGFVKLVIAGNPVYGAMYVIRVAGGGKAVMQVSLV